MIEIQTIADLELLRESEELECKLALGRDGKGALTHGRLAGLCRAHAADVSKTLRDLVKDGFLTRSGAGRGAVYRFSGTDEVTPADVFGGGHPSGSSANLAPERDASGRLLSSRHRLPFVDDLSMLTREFLAGLEQAAAEPRQKKKIPAEAMKAVILDLCRDQFVTIRCLAALLNRQPETLRGQYLSPMSRERKLKLAFPDAPNDSRQAYTSKLS